MAHSLFPRCARLARERGQGLVEYGLILALIAVGLIGSLTVGGRKTSMVFSRASAGLGGAGDAGGAAAAPSARPTVVYALPSAGWYPTGRGSVYIDATVLVLDGKGLPVAGVAVSGTWSDGGSLSGVTASTGKAVLGGRSAPRPPAGKPDMRITFTVTNVTAPPGMTWDGVKASSTATIVPRGH